MAAVKTDGRPQPNAVQRWINAGRPEVPRHYGRVFIPKGIISSGMNVPAPVKQEAKRGWLARAANAVGKFFQRRRP